MSATVIAIIYANGQLAEYVADKHPSHFASYIRSATVAEWTSAITGDSKGWASWAHTYKAAGAAIVGYLIGYLMGGSTVPANPQTPSSGNWRDRLNRAIVMCGAPNYYWHKQTAQQREAILDAVAASGIDGLHFEFGGEFIVQEYIKKPIGGTFAEIYRQRIRDFAPWLAGIRARGLIAEVTWINTNQSKAKPTSDGDHIALVNEFLNAHGTDNMLILPYSETDTRTPRLSGVLSTFKARVPADQLISYAQGQPGNWYETHPSSISKIVTMTTSRTIICSDSGGIIKELKGSSWTGGGTTNTANMAKFAAACRGMSASCVEYSFSREFDFTVPTILAAAYERGGWNMPLVNGPGKTLSAKWTNFPAFSFSGVDRTGWPSKPVDGKPCNGLVYLDGRKCEWVKVGSNSSSIKNAINPKDAKYYRPDLVSGVRTALEIRDVYGKARGYSTVMVIP